MNPERLRKVADAIELSGRFKYSSWAEKLDNECVSFSTIDELRGVGTLTNCGTTGCIAGWAASLAIEEGFVAVGHYDRRLNYSVSAFAEAYLELDSEQGDTLFLGRAMQYAGLYPEDVDTEDILDRATAVEAAKLLRMVADGEVEL